MAAGGKNAAQGAVVDLAWGTATPDTLVALVEPATLLFVRAATGEITRSYSLAHGAVLTGIAVNPWDAASFALTSLSGSLVLAYVETADGRVLGRPVTLPGAGAAPRDDCRRCGLSHQVESASRAELTRMGKARLRTHCHVSKRDRKL